MTDPHPSPEVARRPALMPLDEGLARVLAQAEAPLGAETVSTFEASGRVLARDVVAEITVPAHDNSAMDGYAVRTADCASVGVELPVSQRIPAGAVGTPLEPGSAARIFTGAPIPEGADAVIMQEHTETLADGARVRLLEIPSAGQSVRRAGEDIQAGSVILRAGTRLNAAAVGLAAGVGLAQLEVARRPRVALLQTGDELVTPGTVPPAELPPGAIYNANRFFLRALLEQAGCIVNDLGVVPDQLDQTVTALQRAAADNDLILTSGGVSVGDEDHVKPAVRKLGTLDLWKLAIKPGKPFACGQIRQDLSAPVHFMGLPGNPVSSFITWLLLVRPFLLKLQGATELSAPTLQMRADFSHRKKIGRREFLRVRRNAYGGLDLFPNQSSGVLTSMHWATGLVDKPAGSAIEQGDMVCYLPFAGWVS